MLQRPTHPQESALFTAATTQLLAASGEGGGFQPPSISDFFPPPILFAGTPFEFNRIQLVRLIVTAVVVTVFVVGARRAKLVPGRGQNMLEFVLDFVRVNIAEEVLGVEKAKKYVPLLTTIFVAILSLNIAGVIPGLNIAGTSVIGLPIVFAAWVFVMYLGAGVRAHGVGGFLRTSLFPPGVPPYMYVLLTPIEFLTVFVIRPATLAIRLVANMISGHLMLVLVVSATEFFLVEAGPSLKAYGLVTFGAALALTLFEAFIAALQAYIFVVLAAVYLNLSIQEEH